MNTNTGPLKLIIKTPILLMLTSLIWVGCASVQPTAFEAAEEYGEFGYSDKKLSEDQYQIIFSGNAKTDTVIAKDYALLHAANLTLSNGFSWFEIIQSDTDVETKEVSRVVPEVSTNPTTTSSCGVLGCTISTASTYQGGSVISKQVADKINATLVIKMGSGTPPNPNKVFDAKQLAANLES
ncbi:CC0125/CC1285 family lipoprotein [Aliiglaciecola aliphaticivorans]